MVVRLNRLAIAAIAVTMPLIIHQTDAIAQDVDVDVDIIAPGYVDTPPQVYDETYFSHDPDFYKNRSLGEQIDWMFGVGGDGFIENEIAADGRAINELTNDLLFEQNHSTPIIRTADLPNPFSTSLQSLDRIEALEPVPLPPARTRIVPTAPTARPNPVPALW